MMRRMARSEEHSPNWGGARPNAGRPRLENGKRVERIVSLTEPRLHFVLDTYGKRKLSARIRELIDLDMLARDYELDLAKLVEEAIAGIESDVGE